MFNNSFVLDNESDHVNYFSIVERDGTYSKVSAYSIPASDYVLIVYKGGKKQEVHRDYFSSIVVSN